MRSGISKKKKAFGTYADDLVCACVGLRLGDELTYSQPILSQVLKYQTSRLNFSFTKRTRT